MNLVQFLNKVDETISGYDCEKLLRIIHEIARTLPEQERKDFIKQIKQIDNNDTSNINKKDNNKLETEYKKICDKFIEIENGDIFLREEYNDEYDDWYNSIVEEILYEDPDGIGSVICEACSFVHKCIDVENYELALKMGRKLFMQSVQTNGEYSGEDLSLMDLQYYHVCSFNYRGLLLDTLYACYQVAEPQKRPDIMYEIWANAEDEDIKLENVMKYGGQELKDVDDFISDWIGYLGTKKGYLAERLYKEAVNLSDDVEAKFENAKKYVNNHPGIYLEILNDSSVKRELALKIGMDGVKRIDRQLIVRSKVALKTVEIAKSEGKDSELIEQLYMDAFESDTCATNYLRVFINCKDKNLSKIKMREIIDRYNGKEGKHFLGGYVGKSELDKNVISENMMYILRFLDGEFLGVLNSGVSSKEALGWSCTFMKEGLAIYLLYLFNGKPMHSEIKKMLNITKNAFGSDYDDESFYTIFLLWKSTTQMSDSDKKKIINHIDKLVQKRVAGIMDANKRNYYGECAMYIAALGEVMNAKQDYMSKFAAQYSRRRAFKDELKSFGWVSK